MNTPDNTTTRPQLRVVSDAAPSRPLPANALASERLVVGFVIVDPEAIDRVADILTPVCFYNAITRRVYATAIDLHTRQQPVGLHELIALLSERNELTREMEACLKDLAHEHDGSSTDALEHHARLIRDKYRIRRLGEETARLNSETYGTIENPQEFLDLAENTVYEIAKPPESATAAYVGETLQEILQKLKDGGNCLGLTTGFGSLDKVTTGWRGAELTLLAGRPGMGKTSLAIAMAVRAAHATPQPGKPANGVLIFSLEMNREMIVTRTICAEARIELQRMRLGTLQPADFTALMTTGQWFAHLPILIDDKSALNPIEVRAKARRTQVEWHREGKKRLSLIVIDYLQLMQARHLIARNANREQEINYITESLKNLSKELNVPVLALCQINRGVEARKDKRPMLSDLRESGSLENHADVVMFIHRDEYYLHDKTPQDRREVAEIIVAKQRNGPTSKAIVRWSQQYTAFSEFAPGEMPDYDEDDE